MTVPSDQEQKPPFSSDTWARTSVHSYCIQFLDLYQVGFSFFLLLLHIDN